MRQQIFPSVPLLRSDVAFWRCILFLSPFIATHQYGFHPIGGLDITPTSWDICTPGSYSLFIAFIRRCHIKWGQISPWKMGSLALLTNPWSISALMTTEQHSMRPMMFSQLISHTSFVAANLFGVVTPCWVMVFVEIPIPSLPIEMLYGSWKKTFRTVSCRSSRN